MLACLQRYFARLRCLALHRRLLRANADPTRLRILGPHPRTTAGADGTPLEKHCFSWVRAVADGRCVGAVRLLLAPTKEQGFGYGQHASVLSSVRSKKNKPAVSLALRWPPRSHHVATT